MLASYHEYPEYEGKSKDGGLPAYVAQDPEALTRNLARAVEESGRAMAAYLKPREEGRACHDPVPDAANLEEREVLAEVRDRAPHRPDHPATAFGSAAAR